MDEHTVDTGNGGGPDHERDETPESAWLRFKRSPDHHSYTNLFVEQYRVWGANDPVAQWGGRFTAVITSLIGLVLWLIYR